MYVRRLGTAFGAALFGVVALATPVAARVSGESADPTVYGWTADRAWATTAALLAAAGVVIGGWAMRRSRRGEGAGRKESLVALLAGLIAAANGVANLIAADGGPGTGNGIVGGYIAAVMGLAAAVLGALALARSRRTA